MTSYLKEYLKNKDDTYLQEISNKIGIKNVSELTKDDIIDTIANIFVSVEELNTSLNIENDNDFKLLNDMDQKDLINIYKKCFTDFKLINIKKLSKDVLINNLKPISNISEIIQTYIMTKNKISKKEVNPLYSYLSSLHRNYLRLILKNLNFSNYQKLTKNKLIEEIINLATEKNYKKIDLENIIKGNVSDEKVSEEKYEEYNINIKNTSDIKYIIHISDLHIRRNSRIEEYNIVFQNFYNMLHTDYEELQNKTLICICGDIFHYKTTQRAEGLRLWLSFIKQISSLFPVICILGNHDVDLTTNDIDWIKPLDGILDNFYYFKNTGFYNVNNITFCVSSLIDGKIIRAKKENANKKYIHLYHGTINGSKLFNSNTLTSPYDISDFGHYDLILLGDIHKYQYLNKNKTIAYSGSLVQQNKGESVYNHGFIKWNLTDMSSTFHEVYNPFCFLKVYISDDTYTYENINTKKNLYVSYIINNTDIKKTKELIRAFENEIKSKNINIIKSEYDKMFEDENILELLSDSNLESKTNKNMEEYFIDKLTEEKLEEDSIQKILKIHELISKEVVSDKDDGFKTKWILKNIKFMNIFSYGNDTENEIIFDEYGFYKIFGPNYLGKTSIINIIKWGIFDDDSEINSSDVLFIGSQRASTGYIHIEFKIGNQNIFLYKNLIKSNKKYGYSKEYKISIYENNKKIKDIIGENNAKEYLNKNIGDYKHFELISLINNQEMSIIREKKALSIFNQLFKLDNFIEYENIAKEKIRDLNTNAKALNLNLKSYNDDYKLKIKNLNKIIKDLELKIKNITFYDILLIKELKEKRDITQTKISKILLKEVIQTKNYEDDIKKLYNEIKKINIDNFIITNIKEEIQTYTLQNKKYQEEINTCNKNIREVTEIDIDKIYSKQKKIIDKNDIITEKINVLQEKIISTEYFIKDIQEKIYTVSFDEEELRHKISKQSYDYNAEKNKIIHKINEKINFTDTDKLIILKLLTEQNYQAFLDIVISNKKYEEDISKHTELLSELNMKIQAKKDLLSKNNKKLSELNMNIRVHEDNKIIILNNEKYENDIRILTKRINKNNKKIIQLNNDIQTYYETQNIYTKLNNKIKFLEEEQKKYVLYISALEYNEKYKKIHDELLIDIVNINNEISKMETNNMNMNIKKREYEIEINKINLEISEYTKKKEEMKNINNELLTTMIDLNNYNIYKKLVNEKGIPSIILEDKIPNIEKEINIILKSYTNFSIKIDINGSGSRKKIEFYQIKNTDSITQENNLTINSCSGYENFILNIAFKLVIKKFSYINYSSFICIDEVWEKISKENYKKLYKIFNLLKDNYNHILIISHIDEIKQYLEENYNGKHINILREKDFSLIL